MKEAGAKVKRKNNLQRDRSFNNLQNMLFLVSSLALVAIEPEANFHFRGLRLEAERSPVRFHLHKGCRK